MCSKTGWSMYGWIVLLVYQLCCAIAQKSGCNDNEVFSECGSSCMELCFSEAMSCIQMCETGCFCSDNYGRDQAGACVPRGTETCSPAHIATCKENEEYKECGSTCTELCGSETMRCAEVCGTGCFCSEGFGRDSNGDCVARGTVDCSPGIAAALSDATTVAAASTLDCASKHERFYHDPADNQCRSVEHVGCEHASNRFMSDETCRRGVLAQCQKTVPCKEQEVNCFADPCSVTTCPTFPTADCHSDYCGGCNAFFTFRGIDVTSFCKEEKTECSSHTKFSLDPSKSECESIQFDGTDGICDEQSVSLFNTAASCEANSVNMCGITSSSCSQCMFVQDPCATARCSRYPDAECRAPVCLEPGQVCEAEFWLSGQKVTDCDCLSLVETESDCGSACSEGCDSAAACIAMCSAGCFCAAGLKRHSTGVCVDQELCSANTTVVKSLAQCLQPSDSGPCEAAMEKWYFDAMQLKCTTFQYGGCEGNDNRFDTESDCKQQCPGSLRSAADKSILSVALFIAFSALNCFSSFNV